MAYGRNDYGQCSVNEKNLEHPMPCLYKTESGKIVPVKSAKLFSTGWFHSLMVKDEKLYACGYFSITKMSGKSVFIDVTDIVIKDPFKKITFVGSGDHIFTIVVDNNRIIHGANNLEVFNVNNLKEITTHKSGFSYISTEEKIYQSKGNSLEPVSGSGCYELRSSSVGDFSFKSKSLERSIISSDQYPLDCKIYPSFCSHFVYYPNQRKLYGHGSNSDNQLGLDLVGSSKEVVSINSVLLENPSWDLLEVVCGCDFTIVALGVPFSKHIPRFRNNLWRNSKYSLLTEVEFNF